MSTIGIFIERNTNALIRFTVGWTSECQEYVWCIWHVIHSIKCVSVSWTRRLRV